MTKKILLSLFLLLMAAVSIIAYNFYKNVKQPEAKTSFEVIPQNAALIFQENNLKKVYNKLVVTNLIWEELAVNTETIKTVNTQIKYLDSLLSGPLSSIFSSQPILTSLHLSGGNDFDFIFYIPLNKDFKNEEFIQKIKNTTQKNPTSRTYNGVNIHTITTNNGDKISIINYKKVLAFSYSMVLIEDVIKQLNGESSLMNDVSFSKMIANSSQSKEGNLFINNKYFSKLVNQYLNTPTKEYCKGYENYTDWTELDINIKSNSVSLNGFSFSNDSSSNWITAFNHQIPQNINMIGIAPYNTSYMYHYGLSNPKVFFEGRKTLLKDNNKLTSYQSYLDKQTQKYGIDLEEELLANIGNELAFIITESLTDDFSENKFVVYRITDIAKTKNDLASIGSKVNEKPFDIIPFHNHEINKIEIENLFNNLLGKPFVNLEQHFYTIIDEYVVFGNSVSGLEKFITNALNNKVLKSNASFKSFNSDLSSSSNLFIYNNIARSVNLYKQFSLEKHLPIFDEKLDVFRKFEAISFQMSTEKNGLNYNNIYLKYNPVYKQETASFWELLLDNPVSSAPHIVINHNTNAKEIFVQDVANKIYLISNTGKIIWTKQLQEQIMSDVHQIDVYKNDKLQMLFNTKSKIYLIDRNGHNVESFPVKLNTEATNGISLMDYSNNKNYRILIGCKDKMVYNYDGKGNLVKGWEYLPDNSFAKGEIWHFVLSNKDFLVIPLSNGKVKIVQRDGTERVRLENKLPISGNDIYLKVGNELSKTYLICSDTLGNIIKLFFNDKKEIVNLGDNQKSLNFSFLDFDNNKMKDYVYCYGNTLKIIDEDKKELYQNEFEKSITQKPLFFKYTDNTNRIGIVTENQIFLINDQGEIEAGFPLAGSTAFSISDINNDNTSNLVVAHGKMIYTYSLE